MAIKWSRVLGAALVGLGTVPAVAWLIGDALPLPSLGVLLCLVATIFAVLVYRDDPAS